MEAIVATETGRDAGLRGNDAIEIVLDPHHDHRNAYYFARNAAGALAASGGGLQGGSSVYTSKQRSERAAGP